MIMKIKEEDKDLNYWKKNCEEDYLHTPISVLRYITKLEDKVNNVVLMENLRRVEIVESDNRDVYTTDLILDNGTVVEVDVQDLFENMIENVSEDTVEDYSVEELLEMFEILKYIINS